MGATISFLSWKTIPSCDIHKKPKVGEFLDVKLLNKAGLVFGDDNELLFCREATLHLWEALSKWIAPVQDGRSTVGQVRGPPGTGKSTTTFAWAQHVASETRKSVTWLHVDSLNMVHRVDFRYSSDGLFYNTPPKVTAQSLDKAILNCASNVQILDGAKGNEIFKNCFIPSVRLWAGQKPGARTAIIVSSGALPEVHIQDLVNDETRMEVYQNWSWTREDYLRSFKRARVDSNFGARVTKKRRVAETAPLDTLLDEEILADIDAKYFYAGGCARFFFGFSTEQVKGAIVNAVNSLNKTNIAEVLTTGTCHVETRHRLISLFQDGDSGETRKSIVSQFAVQKLVEHAGEQAFVLLYGMGSTNPSFEGWVFEADFFFQCKRVAEMNRPLILKGEPDAEIHPRSFLDFDHDAMMTKAHPLSPACTDPLLRIAENKLRQEIKRNLPKLADNNMCKPTKWNQGGYDGFNIYAKDGSDGITINFFQVTRGTSHALNLKYFVEVVQLFIYAGMEVKDIEIFFVVPEGQTTSISKVIPHGGLFQSLFGWKSGKEKKNIKIVSLRKTTSTPLLG